MDGLVLTSLLRKRISRLHLRSCRRFYGYLLLAALMMASQQSRAVPMVVESYTPLNLVGEKSTDPHVKQTLAGYAALDAGDLDAAESAFRNALLARPNWMPGLLGMAETSAQRDDLNGAKTYIKKAQELKPDAVEVQIALGRIEFRLKNLPAAETAFKNAAAMRPDDSTRQVDLGDLFWAKSDNPESALSYYNKAIELDPDNSGTYYALGMAYAALNDQSKAQTALRKSADLSPSNPLPLMALGKFYFAEGNFPAALDAYADALKRQPSLYTVLLLRGEIYMAMNDSSAALQEFEKARSLVPQEPSVLVRIAALHQRNGDFAASREAYLETIDIDSENALALNNLAWMLAQRNEQLDDALRWAQKAVAIEANPNFQNTLAAVYKARGERDKAVNTLQELIADFPGRAEDHYLLGVIYQELGENAESMRELRAALKIDPGFPAANDAKMRLKKQAQ